MDATGLAPAYPLKAQGADGPAPRTRPLTFPRRTR